MSTNTSIGEKAVAKLKEKLGEDGSIVQSAHETAALFLRYAAEACERETRPNSWRSMGELAKAHLRRSVDWERIALANHGRTLRDAVGPSLGSEAKAEIEQMMASKFWTVCEMLDNPDHCAWRGCGRRCRRSSFSASEADGAATPRASPTQRPGTWSPSNGQGAEAASWQIQEER